MQVSIYGELVDVCEVISTVCIGAVSWEKK